MSRSLTTALTFAAAILSSSAASRADDQPDGRRWWSHVRFLADDSLEGRNTGSDGHRKAAAYVAREFEAAGLKPAGSDGYFQPIKLLSRAIDEAHSRLALVTSAGERPLTLGDDAVISLRVDPAPEVEADLVFAGYGLTIPEETYDDFKGLDVRGKVVVILSGAPAAIPGPLAAHNQSTAERAGLLKSLGAVGIVSIQNPKNMDIPWERAALARFLPAMTLADPSTDETRGLKIAVAVNPARAERWFEGRATRSARSSTPTSPASPCPISRSRPA